MTLRTQAVGEPWAIRPVQRPAPLRQSVYESLVELVIDGRLKPGQHLVETELARLLGVSRQPVRETLHRLAAEGWVDLRPNQGAFVHVPTDREVDDLLDVRELLEVETARLAARGTQAGRVGSEDQMAALHEICREGDAAVEAGDTERFVALNNQFHAALAKLAGNAALAELAGIVGRRVRWYYRMVAPMRGPESSAEHLELVEAIAAGDEDRAAKAAREHTERTRSAYHHPDATEWGKPRFRTR
ncbi:MAG: GntR family transcriptional regulator [Actinobacteria bacterium]|nr:GntR family transcriptional regulator [Actinomycetota bacterium]